MNATITQPGYTIAGRFTLESQVATGGMGVVYRAADLEAGVFVAVKLQLGNDGVAAERFLQEAEVLARLASSHIVRHVAHGVLDDGRAWLAMEWLSGVDLDAFLRNGPMLPAEALAMVADIAGALSEIHDLGIVHRDIKPGNLYLVDGDPRRARLLDLGIARVVDDGAVRRTGAGMVVGTPAYMAPEQARSATMLDGRADLYSLGVVLYECLTGQAAWPGQNPLAVLVKVLVESPPHLADIAPHLDRRLDAFVYRLMARDPSARPAHAQDVLNEATALAVSLSAGQPPIRMLSPMVDRTRSPMGEGLSSQEVQIVTVVLVTACAGPGALEPIESSDLCRLAKRQAEKQGATATALPNGIVLLTFGDTSAATDRAGRAARAAIALMSKTPAGACLLATGRMDQAVAFGEVIDRAFEQIIHVAPGSVLVDPTTCGLLSARFVLSAASETVDVGQSPWLQLLAEAEPLSSARLVLGRPSPFVGRQRELSLLEGWFREVRDDRVARVVVITGDAGLGKSRLCDEFLGRLLSTCPQIEVLTGSCPPRPRPYAAFADLVRRRVGLDAQADADGLCDAILELVEQRLENGEHVAEVLAHISTTSGVDSTRADRRQSLGRVEALKASPDKLSNSIRVALTSFVDMLASDVAVVLSIDDFQLADEGTRATIKSLLSKLARRPLLLVIAQRGDPDRSLVPSPGEYRHAAIAMLPLGDLACLSLVRDLLPERLEALGEAGIERLSERAGGNPYFLEELIRATDDQGPGAALPETVLAMLQARLNHRSAAEKRVLRAASICGLHFEVSTLRTLLPELTIASIERTLDALAEVDCVVFWDQKWSFVHDELREAAHAMLTEEDRRRGHALLALTRERTSPGDPGAIAEHWVEARNPHRAARWHAQAARLSAVHNDLSGARAWAERGLYYVEDADPATRGQLAQVVAEVLGWQGQYQQSAAWAEHALTHLSPGSIGWYRAMGDALSGTTSAVSHGQLCERLIEETKSCRSAAVGAAAAAALSRTAIGLRARAKGPLAEALYSRAVELAVEVSLGAPASILLRRAAAARSWSRGDLGAAYFETAEALAAFENGGFNQLACGTRQSLGAACVELGHYNRAIELLSESARVAAELGLERVEAKALHALGNALLRSGQLDRALEMESLALRAFETQGDAVLSGACHASIARAHTAAGRAQQGRTEALLALAVPIELAPLLHVFA
ncbi:MAG: hypothetical protein EXR76_09915, partial [Myxococcales bacterium]|nr:hypothetical protein [Myxococcales bacterium]